MSDNKWRFPFRSCYSFRFAEEILSSRYRTVVDEIKHVIFDHIKYLDPHGKGKSRPHDVIQRAFKDNHHWSTEEPISEKIRKKHDLFKNRIAIEIETTSISGTYRDYLKFLTSFNTGKIDVGILLTFSDDYVKKHYQKGRDLIFGRAKRDLELFRLIIPVPILVIALDIPKTA